MVRGIGVRDHERRIDPLSGLHLHAYAGGDPRDSHPCRDDRPCLSSRVAHQERDHAHSTAHVTPSTRLAEHASRGVVEVDARRAGIARTGVRPDDALAEVRHLEALIVEEMLDIFEHRPLEEQFVRLFVAPQPCVDVFLRWQWTDPDVARALGAKRFAQAALHVDHCLPACEIAGSETADFSLALGIVVPQLDARAVFERDEHPAGSGEPFEAALRERQLLDHQLMQ